MIKYTPITKYNQLKDGVRIRCKIQSYGTIEGRLNECADTTILFISDNDEKSFVITRVYFNPEIKRTNPYYFDLELIEEAQDEPEPTIEPYQWYTPQEILDYVKADPRPDEEKRFMIKVEGWNKYGLERSIKARYDNDLIDTWANDEPIDQWGKTWTNGKYKGKMQFIHWCDDNWEKLMEKPLEQQKSGVGSESDFLTKSYDMGVDFGKSEPTQIHLIKIVEKQLPENCKNTIGHFEFTHNGGIFKKYKNLQINLTINYQDKAYTITTPSGGNFIFKNTKNNNLELVKLLQQAVTFAQRELGIK